MKSIFPLCTVFILAIPQPAAAHSSGTYKSQIDAEKRAAELKCKGTYQVDGMWMPCTNERSMHEALKKF